MMEWFRRAVLGKKPQEAPRRSPDVAEYYVRWTQADVEARLRLLEEEGALLQLRKVEGPHG